MIVPGIPYVEGRNDYTDYDGKKYGIAIHNTSNDASDSGEASYATWRPDGVSSHFFVDSDSVTQSVDTKFRVGHAGSTNGNENAIAVEITGTNAKTRQWWLDNVAWNKLGQVLATVIKYHWPDGSFKVRRASVTEMKTNPKVKAFYGHNDMRLAWGGTDHTDPGDNFPWDRLFTAVNAYLEDDVSAEDVWNADMVPAQGLTPGNDFWQAKAALGYAMGQAREANIKADQILANLAVLNGKDFVDEPAIVDGIITRLGSSDVSVIVTVLKNGIPADKLAEIKALL